MKKTAIFDMDGTLLYTLEDLRQATNYALRKNGLKERSLEEVRAFVGNGVPKLIERALSPLYSQELFEIVLADFLYFYELNSEKNTHPYDGILEVLTILKDKGFNIAVNSNKYDLAVKSLCQRYFPMVDVAIGARENVPVKPAPDGVIDILSSLKSGKNKTYFIGDSDVDVKTAKNAGVLSIGVTWGYRTKDCLVGADYIANSPKELLDYLLK